MSRDRRPQHPSLAAETLEEELSELINRRCLENQSDTPDFVLAQFLRASLDAFNAGINERERWYGRGVTEAPSTDDGLPERDPLLRELARAELAEVSHVQPTSEPVTHANKEPTQ